MTIKRVALNKNKNSLSQKWQIHVK